MRHPIEVEELSESAAALVRAAHVAVAAAHAALEAEAGEPITSAMQGRYFEGTGDRARDALAEARIHTLFATRLFVDRGEKCRNERDIKS